MMIMTIIMMMMVNALSSSLPGIIKHQHQHQFTSNLVEEKKLFVYMYLYLYLAENKIYLCAHTCTRSCPCNRPSLAQCCPERGKSHIFGLIIY